MLPWWVYLRVMLPWWVYLRVVDVQIYLRVVDVRVYLRVLIVPAMGPWAGESEGVRVNVVNAEW